VTWSWLLVEAEPWLDPRTDPWLAYPVDLRRTPLPGALPGGLAIYAAMGLNAWQYVGTTICAVAERLRGHRHERTAVHRSAKIAAWEAVMVMPLTARTSEDVLSHLECTGRDLLRPCIGERWGRCLPAHQRGQAPALRSRQGCCFR
jgi:hypothetical protein